MLGQKISDGKMRKYADDRVPLVDVTKWTIENIDECFRYVNHKYRLATTGYSRKRNLIENQNGFLGTSKALDLCRERYEKMYRR